MRDLMLVTVEEIVTISGTSYIPILPLLQGGGVHLIHASLKLAPTFPLSKSQGSPTGLIMAAMPTTRDPTWRTS